jgi:hypothetical protein
MPIPVSPHTHRELLAHPLAGERDPAALVHVLRRIVQQVGEHLGHADRVGPQEHRPRRQRDGQRVPLAVDEGPGRLDGTVDDLGQFDRLVPEVDLARGDPGHVEQVIDEAAQVVHLGGHHLPCPVGGFPVDLAELEQVQGGADRGQGVAQLVGEHRQELVLHAGVPPQLLRLPPQCAPGVLLGEVTQHLGISEERPVVVPDGRDRAVAPEPGAVLADMPAVVPGRPILRRRRPLLGGHAVPDVLGGEEQGVVPPQDLALRVAEEALGPRVPAGHPPLGVEQEDRILGHALDELSESLLVEDLGGDRQGLGGVRR